MKVLVLYNTLKLTGKSTKKKKNKEKKKIQKKYENAKSKRL